MVAPLMAVLPVSTALAADSPGGSERHTSEEAQALAQAADTGEQVEVLSQRTVASQVFATPQGDFVQKTYAVPRWVRKGSKLVEVDTGLARNSDGTLSPKATEATLTFSGGGKTPLASLTRNGRTMSLGWTGELPQPTVDEDTLTYPEVLTGVDLKVQARNTGFSHVLVVKTAEAAKNPELARIDFALTTKGLELEKGGDGGLTARDPAGQEVLRAPAPTMWDSSSPATPAAGQTRDGLSTASLTQAAASESGKGSRSATVDITVDHDSLSLLPDQDLLTGEETTYPVYIDPSYEISGARQAWTIAYKAAPTTSFYNGSNWINSDGKVGTTTARAGYENMTDGTARSYFRMDTRGLKSNSKVISSSVFRIKNTWSWSCTSKPVELWHTSAMSSSTTWSNQPGKLSTLDTVNDAKGYNSSCPAGNLAFDATSAAKQSQTGDWNTITVALAATSETDVYSWKKFEAASAVLVTRYNTRPSVPSKLDTAPVSTNNQYGCGDQAPYQIIGNTDFYLTAKVSDADGGTVQARFRLWPTGHNADGNGAIIDKTVSVPSGSVAMIRVPKTDLTAHVGTANGNFSWKAQASDGSLSSDWYPATGQPGCRFVFDPNRPANPPRVTSAHFPDGTNGWPAETGDARTEGTFVFSDGGVADITQYEYWTSWDHTVRNAKASTGNDPDNPNPEGTASVSLTPLATGPHVVYARSLDKAGNRSDTTSYLFYVDSPKVKDEPGDLNGDGHTDLYNVSPAGHLWLYRGQDNGTIQPYGTASGRDFTGSAITHRGDWTEDGYEDLIAAHEENGRKELYLHPNNGLGYACSELGEHTDGAAHTCTAQRERLQVWFSGNDHWGQAAQVTTVGDIGGSLDFDGDGIGDIPAAPDLLVEEGGRLWLYYGSRSGYLDEFQDPVLIGGTDWNNHTILSPGDANGDGLTDLWLRNKATGEILLVPGQQSADGVLDPMAWGETEPVKVGTGVPAGTYPTVGTTGDITGDGIADLWARKGDNTLIGWSGKAPGTDGITFGESFIIDTSPDGARIPSGTVLNAGQTLASRSVELTMHDDGNLTITSKAGKTLWSTGTAGNTGARAVMRADGNLVVEASSGSTVLWESGTSSPRAHALLQDRGNLVVYDINDESLWSSGTALRHDYNGDGRSDIASWYDYADGHDAMHTFTTGADGLFNAPSIGWQREAGNWWAENMKYVTGDYNGDGRGDVAAFYGYTDGQVKVFTWLSTADGGFQDPFSSWAVAAGRWTFERMHPHSGDFNGDGRDDIAVWYDYADGSDRIWTFLSNSKGGFLSPSSTWNRPPGNWWVENMKFVTGDFDADGRDDLTAWYGYSDGSHKLFTFHASPSGGFGEPAGSWTSTTWGSFERTSLYAGDFNGDGRDDIAAWYDYGAGHDTVWNFFTSSPDGTFTGASEAWSAPAESWWKDHMKIVTGDYNGDGRDDLGALYGYDDGREKMFTWIAKADGTFAWPAAGWESQPENWTFSRVHLIERYN
jgi:hypothetical protein